MILPIIILGIVFILIAIRQIGNVKLQIWQIMTGGALLVLLTQQISWVNALKSINFDVIVFLLCMFIVGAALEESGYLAHLTYKIFKKSKSVDNLILLMLFVFGIGSAILMNDTIAIIGTPIVLLLAKKTNLPAKMLLIVLAFSITIGSVMSPIGNPQNLLIAINGNIKNSFLTFLRYLLIPTLINLIITYLLIRFFYKEHFKNPILNYDHSQEPIRDKKLASLSKISVLIILILIFIKILLITLGSNLDFRITYIAILATLPILLFNKNSLKIIKKVDYHTILFFIAMFILMESVWDTGFFQSIIKDLNINIISISIIFLISILLSQLISNVPLVALYLPLLIAKGAATKEMMALVIGSTIAGNLLILGAASNIIIIHNAEKRSNETITFMEFAKIGIPLTIINVLVYWLFLL